MRFLLRLCLTGRRRIAVLHLRVRVVAQLLHQFRRHLILAEEEAAVEVFAGKDPFLEDVRVQ